MPGYKVRPDVDLLDCSKSVLLHHVKAQCNNYIQFCPPCKDKCTCLEQKNTDVNRIILLTPVFVIDRIYTRIFLKLTAKNRTSANPVITHEKIYRRYRAEMVWKYANTV